MELGYIYKITSPTDKVYIGQTINLKSRMKNYRDLTCKGQIKIYNSLAKYGFSNHKFDVLLNIPQVHLNYYERFFQDFYDCVNNGLNLRYTKVNDKSGSMSEESKAKMSKSQSGKIMPIETKNKISIANKLYATTEHFKLYGNKHNIGKKLTDKTKELMRNSSPNKKKIGKFDISGNLIKEYNSISDAARECNSFTSNIVTNLKSGKGLVVGFKWKYL